MPVFILLLFLGVAVLWLLLSFCFIPIGKFVYRLIKDAKTSMSKDDYLVEQRTISLCFVKARTATLNGQSVCRRFESSLPLHASFGGWL